MIDRLSACGSRTKGTAVMVRALGNEPMAFIAIAAREVVVEVVDEDPEKRASIGVPRRRVFAHDEGLFRKLCASYAGGQHETLSSLWSRATVADLSRLPPMAPATESRTHPS
jgi:hypothetical protein